MFWNKKIATNILAINCTGIDIVKVAKFEISGDKVQNYFQTSIFEANRFKMMVWVALVRKWFGILNFFTTNNFELSKVELCIQVITN